VSDCGVVDAVRAALSGQQRAQLLAACDEHGGSALHVLASGSGIVLQLLLSHVFSNNRNALLLLLLLLLLFVGDLAAVTLSNELLALGADVNAQDAGGFTPLMLAIYSNNLPGSLTCCCCCCCCCCWYDSVFFNVLFVCCDVVLRTLIMAPGLDVSIINTACCSALHYLHRLSPVDKYVESLSLVVGVLTISACFRACVKHLLKDEAARADAVNVTGDTPMLVIQTTITIHDNNKIFTFVLFF
jgi:hypothetical protein